MNEWIFAAILVSTLLAGLFYSLWEVFREPRDARTDTRLRDRR
mgnify:CR=1 FL=1